ncbi:hypothetical protein QI554_42315, partial [Yinghuangia seranimata]|nr:hypothetical protein [Yinghuangia seranimata]
MSPSPSPLARGSSGPAAPARGGPQRTSGYGQGGAPTTRRPAQPGTAGRAIGQSGPRPPGTPGADPLRQRPGGSASGAYGPTAARDTEPSGRRGPAPPRHPGPAEPGRAQQ